MAYYVPDAVDVNGEPEADAWFDDDGVGSYVDEVFISTSQAPPTTCPNALELFEHASMASDDCMPDDDDNAVLPANEPGTASLRLFEAYVFALCELEQP